MLELQNKRITWTWTSITTITSTQTFIGGIKDSVRHLAAVFTLKTWYKSPGYTTDVWSRRVTDSSLALVRDARQHPSAPPGDTETTPRPAESPVSGRLRAALIVFLSSTYRPTRWSFSTSLFPLKPILIAALLRRFPQWNHTLKFLWWKTD